MADLLLDSLELRRPSVGDFLQNYGSLPLSSYAEKLFNRSPQRVIEPGFLRIIDRHAGRLYGPKVAAGLVHQLAGFPIVNSGEHMCLMFHPRRFQSNLLAAFGAMAQELKYLPVLACSTIPMTNSSYPRGIIWDDERIPMVSAGDAKSMVYGQPAFDQASFERVAEQGKVSAVRRHILITYPEAESFLSTVKFEKLVRMIITAGATGNTFALHQFLATTVLPQETQTRILEQTSNASDIGIATRRDIRTHFLARIPKKAFESALLTDQLAGVNHDLWNSVVSEPHGLPSLIYLSMEEVTRDLLIERLENREGWLSKMLLDPKCRQVALEMFADVQGGANPTDHGTQFFWGIDPKLKMLPLLVVGTQLRGKGISIELSRESLIKELNDRRIVPGVLLNTLLLLDSGLHCLGGINQTTYAPLMSSRLKAFCKEFAPDETQHLSAFNYAPAFLCGPLFFFAPNRITGKIRPGSLPDFLRNSAGSMGEVQRYIGKLTVKQAVVLGCLDLYKTIVPLSERTTELQTLDFEQLLNEVIPNYG